MAVNFYLAVKFNFTVISNRAIMFNFAANRAVMFNLSSSISLDVVDIESNDQEKLEEVEDHVAVVFSHEVES